MGICFGKSKKTIGKANNQIENTGKQEQEIKSVWEQVPGKIIKSGTSVDSTIKVYYLSEEITRSSFRIKVKGTNDDGEKLKYTLIMENKDVYIDGVIASSAETSKTEEEEGAEVYWDITGLSQNTEYKFEIIAEDSVSSFSFEEKEKTLKNNKPELEVEVSNITTTTATITAIGTDADGDTLSYTLVIGDTTDTNNTGIFDVENLAAETTYTYTVTVSDSISKTSKTDSFTTTVENNPPVITSTKASNLKTKSATVTVTATDADGDTLSYTLVVANNKTYTNSDGIFYVTGLTRGTTYSYTAKVSDGKATTTKTDSFTTLSNTDPTLSVSVSGETESSVTITATGSDADGDTLQYTLTINGHTYGPSTTKSWTEEELTRNTSYPYKVTVTDGYGGSAEKSGNVYTLTGVCETCGGSGKTTVYTYELCKVCGGSGKIPCTGTFEYSSSMSDRACDACINDLNNGNTEGFESSNGWTTWTYYKCKTCNATNLVCGRCSVTYASSGTYGSVDHLSLTCTNGCTKYSNGYRIRGGKRRRMPYLPRLRILIISGF